MKRATRHGFYDGLVDLAREKEDIVVLDADLGKATGSEVFQKAYPKRYVDAGIAEQNMVGMAIGFARTGLVPFCGSMAVFVAGRAFEIIRNGAAYSHINLKVVGSHSGVTASGDGGTHQGILDIALMRSLPGMVVLSPCDYNEAYKMARVMYEYNGPMYIRTSRESVEDITSKRGKLSLGKAEILKSGEDVLIISTGMMTSLAIEASLALQKKGISAEVMNIHTIKPLDSKTILKEVRKCKGRVVVAEEANVIGGLGEEVSRLLVEEDGVKFREVGVEDKFGQSGETEKILSFYGITSENIIKKVKEELK